VLVPVNFRLAPPEVAFVVEDAGAELLFVGADFYPLVEKVAPELKSVRRIIALDGAHGDWETYTDWVARQSDRDSAVEVAAGNCAIQLYTSGTTGHPKGAQLSHANLLTLLPGALRQFGNWHEKDVNLVCMPLFHIGGSGWGLIGFYRGVESVLMRDADPAAILRLIPEFRITKVFVVPALILFMLQSPQCRATDFSSLELIVYGASPAPVDLVRNAVKVFGCGLAQVYGLTETTGAITYLPPEDHDEHVPARLKSCGKAMTSVELRVVDALDNDVAVGEVGEIICRSPQIMLGYWNQPEATGKAVRSGWFHSGDAGYLDRDGYLYIYDRVKDMIISGGENIYPAEVENALFSHPAVADVAVIGVPDDKWGEAVKAVVVRKPGAEVTPEALMVYARERIAGYKVPRSVDFVDALPRNPTGKILKRELRKPYWAGQERQVH
jgi:acyl-CoA synthetase (AMP-forming)/AMP-acid ligase II